MARRNRESRTPTQSGWVTVQDMHRNLLWNSGRIESGAEDVLQAKFCELAAEGWQLEGRHFDMQFARREGERVLVGIFPTDPTQPVPTDHSTPAQR